MKYFNFWREKISPIRTLFDTLLILINFIGREKIRNNKDSRSNEAL